MAGSQPARGALTRVLLLLSAALLGLPADGSPDVPDAWSADAIYRSGGSSLDLPRLLDDAHCTRYTAEDISPILLSPGALSADMGGGGGVAGYVTVRSAALHRSHASPLQVDVAITHPDLHFASPRLPLAVSPGSGGSSSGSRSSGSSTTTGGANVRARLLTRIPLMDRHAVGGGCDFGDGEGDGDIGDGLAAGARWDGAARMGASSGTAHDTLPGGGHGSSSNSNSSSSGAADSTGSSSSTTSSSTSAGRPSMVVSAAVGCGARRASLELALPPELFACSAEAEPGARAFFLQVQVELGTQECSGASAAGGAAAAAAASDATSGGGGVRCAYVMLTAECDPDTCTPTGGSGSSSSRGGSGSGSGSSSDVEIWDGEAYEEEEDAVVEAGPSEYAERPQRRAVASGHTGPIPLALLVLLVAVAVACMAGFVLCVGARRRGHARQPQKDAGGATAAGLSSAVAAAAQPPDPLSSMSGSSNSSGGTAAANAAATAAAAAAAAATAAAAGLLLAQRLRELEARLESGSEATGDEASSEAGTRRGRAASIGVATGVATGAGDLDSPRSYSKSHSLLVSQPLHAVQSMQPAGAAAAAVQPGTAAVAPAAASAPPSRPRLAPPPHRHRLSSTGEAASSRGGLLQQSKPPSPYASPYVGSPYAGSPYAGSPFAGSPFAGSPYAGTPQGGSPFAGSPYNGSPYNGSPHGSRASTPRTSWYGQAGGGSGGGGGGADFLHVATATASGEAASTAGAAGRWSAAPPEAPSEAPSEAALRTHSEGSSGGGSGSESDVYEGGGMRFGGVSLLTGAAVRVLAPARPVQPGATAGSTGTDVGGIGSGGGRAGGLQPRRGSPVGSPGHGGRRRFRSACASDSGVLRVAATVAAARGRLLPQGPPAQPAHHRPDQLGVAVAAAAGSTAEASDSDREAPADAGMAVGPAAAAHWLHPMLPMPQSLAAARSAMPGPWPPRPRASEQGQRHQRLGCEQPGVAGLELPGGGRSGSPRSRSQSHTGSCRSTPLVGSPVGSPSKPDPDFAGPFHEHHQQHQHQHHQQHQQHRHPDRRGHRLAQQYHVATSRHSIDTSAAGAAAASPAAPDAAASPPAAANPTPAAAAAAASSSAAAATSVMASPARISPLVAPPLQTLQQQLPQLRVRSATSQQLQRPPQPPSLLSNSRAALSAAASPLHSQNFRGATGVARAETGLASGSSSSPRHVSATAETAAGRGGEVPMQREPAAAAPAALGSQGARSRLAHVVLPHTAEQQ